MIFGTRGIEMYCTLKPSDGPEEGSFFGLGTGRLVRHRQRMLMLQGGDEWWVPTFLVYNIMMHVA
jgi:hypothetical protein